MGTGLCAQSAAAAEPGLVGQWTFDNGSGSEATGNWSSFALRGNASIANGELAVTTAGGWGRADGYTGPAITDKTLISWVRLDNLSAGGSPLSLREASENFDAIVYGERQANRWMAGSDFFRRTQDFSPGATDTASGPTTTRQVVIAYRAVPGGQQITGCLNGAQLGQYFVSSVEGFSGAEGATALFGPRHLSGGNPVGSLQAHIGEARLYNRAMGCSEAASIPAAVDASINDSNSSLTAFALQPMGMDEDPATGDVFAVSRQEANILKKTRATSGFAFAFNTGSGAFPTDVEVDASGNLYVSLYGANRVRKYSPTGALLGTVEGFNRPHGVAVDDAGNVYVAEWDGGNLWKVSTNAWLPGTTSQASSFETGPRRNMGSVIGDVEFANGSAYLAVPLLNRVVKVTGAVEQHFTSFSSPLHLSIAGSKLYVAEWGNGRVRVRNLATPDATGSGYTLYWSGDIYGVLAASDAIYLANASAGQIRRYRYSDTDGDGVDYATDTCATVANPDQADLDGDARGDVCDADDDGDGVPDTEDAFPLDEDESVDTDGDGTGNNADSDDDDDGVSDGADAFPLDAGESVDTDGDGTGNNADGDDDGDAVDDGDDAFPLDASEHVDTDGDETGNNADTDDDQDGVPDTADAFPLDAGESVDTDGDGAGNNADSDDDGDGIADADDRYPLDPAESTDSDGDGIGNNADSDDDNDGALDTEDAFPTDPGESVDTDGDGSGNNADGDDDNDGVADGDDAFPRDAGETTDTDGDGTGNNADGDDDNDGVDDADDAFPLDGDEQVDTDGDGSGNNADTDDDEDGVADAADAFPLDAGESVDTDGDGTGNNADADDDGDGIADAEDRYPLDAAESTDSDDDGIGDNADSDDDNDGVSDSDDAFPTDPDESKDTDGDGTGNNADADDDGDGVSDGQDTFPLDADESIDTDGDGTGNNADSDDDNDGVPDSQDTCGTQGGGAQNGCPLPTTTDRCKKDGWKNYGTTFKNQGDCVSYIATRGTNTGAGS